MSWDEHDDDDDDALTKLVQKKNSTVRIYEYTAAAVPVRTQGNGTPPGELWGVYIRISRITCSNEINNWWNFFERSELTVQYCCCTYIRVRRRSSTSTYPRKRYATRRAVRRYIHTYTCIPYHLQQRNNELMKFTSEASFYLLHPKFKFCVIKSRF